MAYVPVSKDLTKVKSKVLFNLTKRQLICFGGGALIGVPLFFLLRGSLGAAVETLNGKDRLRLLHSIFHMDTQEKFAFEWDWLPRTGLSTRDFIAPTDFEFREGRRFRMGGTLGAVSFLQILAPELNDRMLADFLNMESSLIVSLHIQSIDQTAAIRQIKRKITDLDKSKIEEQKKAIRAGYDIDILPSDLATYGGEAKKLLEDLQSHNERMFLVTFLVMNTAGTRQQLENRVFQAQGIAQKYNCALERLDFQQEKGMVSSLPLGLNQIEIQRGLTTSSTAIFVPFVTQELFQTEGEPLYYGLNALSNNLIMVDRKRLKTPNGLILGTPGSGKSFSVEIWKRFRKWGGIPTGITQNVKVHPDRALCKAV